MHAIVCSRCAKNIPAEAIDVAKDTAQCRACGLTHRLSELPKAVPASPPSTIPPTGDSSSRWYRFSHRESIAGVSQRSVKEASGALAVTLFANTILALVVALLAWKTYDAFTHPTLGWSPLTMMGLWLFLLPFIAIGLMTIGQLITALCGFTEVRVSNGVGVVHRGWGPLGWNRKFDPSVIQSARIQMEQSRISSAQMEYIVLEAPGGERFRFGQTLTHDDKSFLLSALRRMLPQLA